MKDNQIINESNERCRSMGLDPDSLPVYHKRYTAEELQIRLNQYKEILEVTHYFIEKFLASVAGFPFCILISDNEGYLLEFKGDPSIIDTIRKLGIVEGAHFGEELGTSSVHLSLRHKKPVQLVGEDHYHTVLHGAACATAPFYDRDTGQIAGTISFMTDTAHSSPYLLALLCTIADSIERELLLRRQNTQLQILNQVLLDTNYLGVVITDGEGIVMEMNERSLSLLEHGRGGRTGIIGTSVYGLEGVGAYFEKVIRHQESCIGAELSVPYGHSERSYLLDVVPVYDRKRRLIRAVGSLRDITKMKTTEEMLRNTEKLVFAGQLAVNIAHEIRNPMTTVKGMLQLSSKALNPDFYSLMMTEIERIDSILSEFLILGKPQPEKFREESVRVILQEVIGVIELQFATNGIAINVMHGQEKPILCDRAQIRQAFMNILKNALEALPFGGKIDIETDAREGYQRIRFTDNGAGMTEKVLKRIGEPFHTTRRDANGLGLMMVNRIMKAHNGRMLIESEVDAGTMVELLIPSI
ncbi:PAS domain-containing sensor histidine kinase [Paenibacillus sp. N4]|uniref:ATP-binding protein n=1 Tax=Paenibacillus vietnamensis TaxID=2590547 RepID=UPI001CD0533F|nr:ATP-binding protein [Paenibacillus vietnamensis]MCA0756559.1 PAS domain-containing sensor histidine kinase [Paenibacillus vietnamensis]